jgi:hypothetical protein
MASQQNKSATSDAASTFSESTTSSYSKPSESGSKTESKTESQPKKSWRKRVKQTLKEVGYPPTHHYDLQSGNKRPEYGIYGDSVFTDKRSTRMN